MIDLAEPELHMHAIRTKAKELVADLKKLSNDEEAELTVTFILQQTALATVTSIQSYADIIQAIVGLHEDIDAILAYAARRGYGRSE